MRPIAIALSIRDGKILVGQFFDTSTGAICYRPLGGGINPDEDPEAAMRREMLEELGAELLTIKLHSTFENNFFFRGKDRHELVHLFEVEFADAAFYDTDLNFLVNDTTLEDPEYAKWLPIAFFQSGEGTLFPKGLLERINPALLT